MNLEVKRIGGDDPRNVIVEHECTLLNLKSTIGVEDGDKVLFKGTNLLDDDASLSSFGIADGDTIHILASKIVVEVTVEDTESTSEVLPASRPFMQRQSSSQRLHQTRQNNTGCMFLIILLFIYGVGCAMTAGFTYLLAFARSFTGGYYALAIFGVVFVTIFLMICLGAMSGEDNSKSVATLFLCVMAASLFGGSYMGRHLFMQKMYDPESTLSNVSPFAPVEAEISALNFEQGAFVDIRNGAARNRKFLSPSYCIAPIMLPTPDVDNTTTAEINVVYYFAFQRACCNKDDMNACFRRKQEERVASGALVKTKPQKKISGIHKKAERRYNELIDSIKLPAGQFMIAPVEERQFIIYGTDAQEEYERQVKGADLWFYITIFLWPIIGGILVCLGGSSD